ncbi:hypothetical protein ACVODF_14740 [Shigella flexneri]
MMMTKHPTGIYVGCLVKVIRRRLRMELKESILHLFCNIHNVVKRYSVLS